MSETIRAHNLVQRRKRVSKARRKKLKKERDIKHALATRILTNEDDDMPPLNPLEKRDLSPIIEDGEIPAAEPAREESRCVIC